MVVIRTPAFTVLLDWIWFAGLSQVRAASAPTPVHAPVKTHAATDPPPASYDDYGYWFWVREIGGGAAALAFLIVFLQLIVFRRPLTTYRVPPKSTAARIKKPEPRPSRPTGRAQRTARDPHP